MTDAEILRKCPNCGQELPDGVSLRVPGSPTIAAALGLYPCNYCDMGWASTSGGPAGVQETSCRDNCEILKEYHRARKKEAEDG